MSKKIYLNFVGFFMVLGLCFSFVSADFSSSKVQYTQSVGSYSYLQTQGISLYPNFANGDFCEAGQDFILQISPEGCSPSVVRSDLLEEQNVPVFCPILATKVNPLIEVEAINSMSFNGDYPFEVSGVGFHPAQAAIKGGSSSLLNSPVLENIGYAVVVLRKAANESSLPEFVEGNLTATIRYDINNAFGVGEDTRYLPVLNSEEWKSDFNAYSFWRGQGYLRAESVDENGAVISVYEDESGKISSFSLGVGDSSKEFYLPGFYCRAGAKVRLEGLENPDTRAKILVNGDFKEVAKGEKFLEERCRVVNLEKKGLYQEVTLSCDNEKFTLDISPKVKFVFGEAERALSVGDSLEGYSLVYLDSSGDVNKKENLVAYFVKSSSDLSGFKISSYANRIERGAIGEDILKVSFGEKVGEYSFEGFVGENDRVFENEAAFRKYFEAAQKDYLEIVDSFGSEKEKDVDLETFGEKAYASAIELAKNTEQGRTMVSLCSEFKEKFFNSYENVKSFCEGKYLLANSGSSRATILVNGVSREISFLGISEPSLDEYGAKIRIGSKSYDFGKNTIIELEENSEQSVQLVSLTEDSAELKINVKSASSDAGVISSRVILKKNFPDKFESVYTFELEDVNLKKVAKVKIIPSIKQTGTEANVHFKIGIEKRAISLAPEQIEKKIEELNKTIQKWSEISENLGTMVKGFKAACFATGTVLTVKNFFSNVGGKAEARQTIMPRWKEKCADEVAAGKYSSLDSCFLENSDAIDFEVENMYEAMKESEFTEEERDSSFGSLAKEMSSSEEILSPYGADEKVSVGESSNVYAALTKKEGDSYLVYDSEVRDLKTINSALENAEDEEYREFLEKERYKILKDIDVRAKGYSTAISTQDELNNFNLGYSSYAGKDAVQGTYSGGTINSNSLVGAEGLEENTEYPVEVISYGVERYVVVLDGSESDYSVKKVYKYTGVQNGQIAVGNDVTSEIGNKFSNFKKYDKTSYRNEIVESDQKVKYFETEPYKGKPAIVPFDIKAGWYASMQQTLAGFGNIQTYEDSGQVASFKLCNVGQNKRIESSVGYGDDICRSFNPGTGQIYGEFPGLTKSETDALVQKAIRAVNDASSQYKKGMGNRVNILGQSLEVGNPAVTIPEVQCQDFMSPSDCHLLFNVCDPVICPSSRCDLGGSFPVSDVIQSGIVGSIALCLPNIQEKIIVPVCLTGIKAGIDGLLSVYTSYRDCLQTNLETGKTIGVCDEIHSIYLCEFFWRQMVPVLDNLVPTAINVFLGQGQKGGGEYLGVQSAWDNAEGSIDYMTNYYGANSFEAFKARSTEDVGSEVCKNFVSTAYPSSGDFLEGLLEPDSPVQFHGRFDEIPFSSGTVPPTSQYKVFYHIYAGNDRGSYYRVYLKSPGTSSYYQTSPSLTVASGFVAKGAYASETRDFTGVSGYKELCINVNGKDECGFQQVSTSFAIDYLEDKYVQEQVQNSNIKTESECVSGSSSLYSLVSPNLQEGTDEVLNPAIYDKGIVRVCSTDNPGLGKNEARWTDVGYCGNEKLRCWLDSSSVREIVQSSSIESEILGDVEADYLEKLLQEGNYMNYLEEKEKLLKLSAEKKISIIDAEFIERAFYGYEKAGLLLIRADAESVLAKADYEKIKNSVKAVEISCGEFRSAEECLSFLECEWDYGNLECVEEGDVLDNLQTSADSEEEFSEIEKENIASGDCNRCGNGLTNVCDEKECKAISSSCVFIPRSVGVGGTCSEEKDEEVESSGKSKEITLGNIPSEYVIRIADGIYEERYLENKLLFESNSRGASFEGINFEAVLCAIATAESSMGGNADAIFMGYDDPNDAGQGRYPERNDQIKQAANTLKKAFNGENVLYENCNSVEGDEKVKCVLKKYGPSSSETYSERVFAYYLQWKNYLENN